MGDITKLNVYRQELPAIVNRKTGELKKLTRGWQTNYFNPYGLKKRRGLKLHNSKSFCHCFKIRLIKT